MWAPSGGSGKHRESAIFYKRDISIKVLKNFGFKAIEQWLSNLLVSQTLLHAPEIRDISMHLQMMTAPATTTHPVYTLRGITISIWVLILPMHFCHTYLHSYGTKKLCDSGVRVWRERERAQKQVKHK